MTHEALNDYEYSINTGLEMFNLWNSGYISRYANEFFGCPKRLFSPFTFKTINVRKLAYVTITRKIKKKKYFYLVLTFSLSTLPWKKRNKAASEKSPLEASIKRWAASAPDRTLDPSSPKNGRTIVWNHNKANLQNKHAYQRPFSVWILSQTFKFDTRFCL